jgi:hypothetical protein
MFAATPARAVTPRAGPKEGKTSANGGGTGRGDAARVTDDTIVAATVRSLRYVAVTRTPRSGKATVRVRDVEPNEAMRAR